MDTNEDSPNAQHARHQEEEEEEAVFIRGVNTVRIRPMRNMRDIAQFKTPVQFLRSLDTCLIYSCGVVFTLITLSTPARVQ